MGLHRAKDSLADFQNIAAKAMSSRTLSIAIENYKQEQEDEARMNGTLRERQLQQKKQKPYWEMGSDDHWSDFEMILPLKRKPSDEENSSPSSSPDNNKSYFVEKEKEANLCFPCLFPFLMNHNNVVIDDGDNNNNNGNDINEEKDEMYDVGFEDEEEEALVINAAWRLQRLNKSAVDKELYIDEDRSRWSNFHLGVENNFKKGGIIRQTSIVQQIYMGVDLVRRKTFTPLLYQHAGNKRNKSRAVHFRPVIAVVPIQSQRDMEMHEKWGVWWQMRDFEIFKAEIQRICNEQGPNEDDDVNWWHKYGDSRRGVEKYAYGGEAKEAMEFAKRSVSTVVAKQRQLLGGAASWDNTKVEEQTELAVCYREHAAWASDLALAWAASDADAVKTNFNASKRKSREFYLLKQLMKHQQKVHKHSPTFMIPKGIPTLGYLNDQELLPDHNITNHKKTTKS